MPTPAAVFDSSIDRWIAEGHTPWGRLRVTMTLANLRRHLGPGPLDILDAGGGNGRDSIPLAAEGHRLTIAGARLVSGGIAGSFCLAAL